MKRAILALAALQACAPKTNPTPDDGVIVQTRTRYYQVDASSQQALNRSIFEERRKGEQRNWLGATNTNTRWTYVAAPVPGGCQLTNVVVTLNATVSLPRWTPPGTTSGARREWWSKIDFAITQHERKHVQIAEDGARAIAGALRGMKDTDCNTLRRAASNTANREFAATRNRQVAFDRSDGTIPIPAPPP